MFHFFEMPKNFYVDGSNYDIYWLIQPFLHMCQQSVKIDN